MATDLWVLDEAGARPGFPPLFSGQFVDAKRDCLGARRERGGAAWFEGESRGGVGVVTLRPAHMSHFASLDEFCRPDGVGEAKSGVVWAVPVPACVTGGEEHVLLRFAV